ncbi:MAG: hypothetical protein WBC36_10280, partial [Desulfobacterales bacterium]
EGLKENEQIVISAQFMLDSESRLREAIQKMLEVRQQGAPTTDIQPKKMEDNNLDMTDIKMEKDDLDMSDMKMDETTETSKAHQHK